MKRVKLISDNPEINGKEAYIRLPNLKSEYYINGKPIVIKQALYDVLEDTLDTMKVVLINFNELPETFNIQVLVERVKYDMYDCKKRVVEKNSEGVKIERLIPWCPCENNIERRFRQLRQEGKLNYRPLDSSKRIYTKNVPEVKQLHRAYSGVTTAEIPVLGEISKTR